MTCAEKCSQQCMAAARPLEQVCDMQSCVSDFGFFVRCVKFSCSHDVVVRLRCLTHWAAPARIYVHAQLSCACLVGKILSHGCHHTGTCAENARIRSTLPQQRTGRLFSGSRFCCKANLSANPWSMHAPVATMTQSWVWDRHARLQLGSICWI